jgi:hypothetical protein
VVLAVVVPVIHQMQARAVVTVATPEAIASIVMRAIAATMGLLRMTDRAHAAVAGLDQIAVRQTVLRKAIVAETEHVLHQTHVAVTRVGKETVHVQHILAMR